MTGEAVVGQGEVGARPPGRVSAGAGLALTGTQNWAARSHRELYDSVHVGNDPGRVGELAQDWTRLGQEISESGQWMSERVRASEHGWQGAAAAAARAAIEQLADWSRTAGETAEKVGGQLGRLGRIMEVARASMPEPVPTSLDSDVAHAYATGGLTGLSAATVDMKAKRDQAAAAHAQAVAVMTRMDTESRAVDAGTPRFVSPPNPLQAATNQPARAVPTSDAHLLATTHSAAVDQPGGTGSAGAPRDASPSGGSGDRPAGVQQQRSGGGNTETGLLPAGGFSPTGKGNDTVRKIAVEQQGAVQGADAKPSEAPQRQQDGVQPADAKVVRHQPGETTSQAATGVRGTSAAASQAGANPDELRHARSTLPSESAAVGGSAGPSSRPRGSSASRRPVAGWSGSLAARSGHAGGTGTAGSVRGPGKVAAGGGGPADTASGPGAGPGLRGGPSPSSGMGATNGVDANTASGSGMASGPSTSTGPNTDPGAGTGVTSSGSTMSTGSNTDPGSTAGTGAGMGIGAGGTGMGADGQGGRDQQRSSKYREGEPVVEVPGADLPPPVIGAGKKSPKPQGEQ